MARRPPIVCQLPFTYWVFGRPVSVQNEDGRKPAALARWRGTVTTALTEAVDALSRRRRFILVESPVDVSLVWLSLDPSDPTHPDLNNMLKPFIDALNERIIVDDRQVRGIRAVKAPINRPPPPVADVMADIEDDPRFVMVAEVTIVRVDAFPSAEGA